MVSYYWLDSLRKSILLILVYIFIELACYINYFYLTLFIYHHQFSRQTIDILEKQI